MKCPKCGYVGFEDLGRCRHCGYDFSLSSQGLPLFSSAAPDEDLPLITRPSPPRPPLAVRRATPEIERARTPLVRTPLLDLDPTPDQAAAAAAPVARPVGSRVAPAVDATIGARLN